MNRFPESDSGPQRLSSSSYYSSEDEGINRPQMDYSGQPPLSTAWKLSDESEEEQTQGGTLSNNYNSASSKGFVTGRSVNKMGKKRPFSQVKPAVNMTAFKPSTSSGMLSDDSDDDHQAKVQRTSVGMGLIAPVNKMSVNKMGQKRPFSQVKPAVNMTAFKPSTSSGMLSDDSDDEHQAKVQKKSVGMGLIAPASSGLGLAASEGFIKKTSDQQSSYSSAAQKMMAMMGYQKGLGLGKNQQGRADIVEASQQRGRRGLGLHIKGFEQPDVEWNFEKEEVEIKEMVEWLKSCEDVVPDMTTMMSWIIEGPKKHTIDDETEFCSEKILSSVLKCKSVFDHLEPEEMRKARTKSNPFETIRGAFFLNRAAMKMANMDAALDFMFTNPKDKNGFSLVPQGELLYFGDVCAGPGGFSEYVLWRKNWDAKGFGFTLQNGTNEFKLEDFHAASSELFEPHYGEGGIEGDGDIYKEKNLDVFQKFVKENSGNKGLHFLMADGGFSVDGQENIQEIRSKRLYLCQFLSALMLLRPGGHFVCKLFDLFTMFSVGVVYLMYRAFDQILIFKPVTSRPANSERYIVCKGLREDAAPIEEYMKEINRTLQSHGVEVKNHWDVDVLEVVSPEVLAADEAFLSYIVQSNEKLGWKQAIGLSKIQAFAQNGKLHETRQSDIREKCLELWKIPDKLRTAPQTEKPKEKVKKLVKEEASDLLLPAATLDLSRLESLPSVMDYRCIVSGPQSSCLLISQGKTNIHKWMLEGRGQWEKLDGIKVEIPRETILEAQIVTEYKGEGRGQRKVMALHVLDAMMLGSTDISALPFNERVAKIKKFLLAIHRPSRNDLAPIRMKEVFRLETISEVFDRLSMRLVKGSGSQKRLCYQPENVDWFFMPAGIYLIKIIKDPWMMAWSKSRRMKYFFNTKNRTSLFQAQPDTVAAFKCCQKSRLYWEWQIGVKVHDDQTISHKDKLSRDQVLHVVNQKMREIT